MQILECISKCADSVRGEKFFQTHFIFSLLADRINAVGLHCILIGILFHLRVDLFLGYLVDDVNQIAQCVIVTLPAVFDLALYAVAVGNRHLAHIVAEGSHL